MAIKQVSKSVAEKSRKIAWLFVLSFVMMIAFTPAYTWAAGGDGSGGGGGGGGANPLSLYTANPAMGSENVPIDTKIQFDFSNNVVNLLVKDHNMQCFSLRDAQGQDIPIAVEMGDDQIDPEIKRIIVVAPEVQLAQETTYILKVDKSLTAKNGRSMATDREIVFSTGTLTPEWLDYIERVQLAENAVNQEGVNSEERAGDTGAADNEDKAGNNALTPAFKYASVACLILVVVMIAIVVIKRRGKN